VGDWEGWCIVIVDNEDQVCLLILLSLSCLIFFGCSTESPLLDLRYWTLLLSIHLQLLETHKPSTKTWLAPLIHRLPPLTNVIITFLGYIPASANPNDNELALLDVFTKSLILLFPHASRRISIDALGEVLCAIFRFLARGLVATQWDGTRKFFLMILTEYKRAFGVAPVGMKKKVSF
jgi:hypothetical protein